jgi:hypothetical protein
MHQLGSHSRDLTHRCNTRIRHWEVDGHTNPKLTTEPSDAGKQAAENDTSNPQLGSSSDHVVGGRTADCAETGNDRIRKSQK